MKSLACCAALLCLWVSVTAQDEPDISEILDRINDEILDGTYTARVEVTRADKDTTKTYTIMEYHDTTTGLHSIDMTSLNKRKFFYRTLGKGTIATVGQDKNCQIQTVEEAAAEPESFIYAKHHAMDDSIYYLGPTSVILEMSTDTEKWLYVPDEEVRGIDANRFSNRNDTKAKKVIDIWFAIDQWDTRKLSSKKVPFPLRVQITEGDVTDQFDFYQVEDLSPREAFRLGDNLQAPFDSTCALPPAKVVPVSLLSSFSFTSLDNSGITAKEYFSIDDNLYRADGNDGSFMIHDDNRGLIYNVGSGCTIEPNTDVVRTVLSRGSPYGGAEVIQAYLTLPKKTKVGEGFVRGIPVDVWDAIGTNETEVKKARFFFSKPAAVLSANGNELTDADGEGSQMFVKALILDSGANADIRDVDIYDFTSSAGDLDFRNNFNIEDCAEASTYIELGFQTETAFNVEEFKLSNAMKELIEDVEENIREFTAVSPLQLPEFKGEVVDGNNVTVTVKVLAPPRFLHSFTKREQAFQHYEGTPRDAPDEEDCARDCHEQKCPTFLFCGTSKCQILKSSNQSDWGKLIPTSEKNCYAYDHVPVLDTAKRMSLEAISYYLKNAFLMFWQPVKVSTGDKQFVTLRAAKYYDHLTQFNKQGFLGPYMWQFSGYDIKDNHESSTVVGGPILTVGQCYRECRNRKDIACSSFSLCTRSQHCVLTSENINSGTHNSVDQAKAIKKSTQDCSIYSVNYLSEFEKLDGKVRKSGYSENDAAETAGECAVKCRQQDLKTLEDCRSFDFCSDTKMCFFYRTHYGWDGGDDAIKDRPVCDHYALRYSASYTAISKGVFLDKPVKKVTDIKFEECAKQCSERSNEECKTISYCDSTLPNNEKETCYMYAANVEDLFDTNNQETTCTVYTKDEAIDDEIINPKRQIEKEKQSNQIGMGDGAFAFLLIAMIAIGAILGAVGWFQREKISALIGRGSAPTTGTTISYNRQDDSNTEA